MRLSSNPGRDMLYNVDSNAGAGYRLVGFGLKDKIK